MNKYEAVERVLEIKEHIQELVAEARGIARSFVGSGIHGLDAYVFEQILEHCDKGNPYNQDLNDVASMIENSDSDQEADLDD